MKTTKEIPLQLPVNIPHIYTDISYLEGDTTDIIEYLQDLPNLIRDAATTYREGTFPDVDKFERLCLEIDTGDSYNESQVILRAFRTETNLEMKARIKNQKEAAKKRKEAIDISIARKEKEEKELYEKLKAKYENGTGI